MIKNKNNKQENGLIDNCVEYDSVLRYNTLNSGFEITNTSNNNHMYQQQTSPVTITTHIDSKIQNLDF